jgi:hypothetical protein
MTDKLPEVTCDSYAGPEVAAATESGGVDETRSALLAADVDGLSSFAAWVGQEAVNLGCPLTELRRRRMLSVALWQRRIAG